MARLRKLHAELAGAVTFRVVMLRSGIKIGAAWGRERFALNGYPPEATECGWVALCMARRLRHN